MKKGDENIRPDKLNSNEEILGEVKESLTDIVDTIDEFALSLTEKDILKILNSLSENEMHKVLHELYRIAPENAKKLTNEIDSAAGENETILREILYSVAVQGFLPKRFVNTKISDILFSEIYTNDPKVIQDLNKVEEISDVLANRYRLQKILVAHYKRNNPKAPEFVFDNLETSLTEDALMIEGRKAKVESKGLFDDYMVEYELGKERQYEVEEIIYLGKRLLKSAEVEKKKVPDKIVKEIQAHINTYNSKSYNLMQVSIDSNDPFSFHQFRDSSITFNYGYFNSDISKTEFLDSPVLNDKPVMLLLHGMLRDWAYWRTMIKTLLPYYQIIVPDMNGYGDSSELVKIHTLKNYAGYLTHFIKKLNITEFSLMGHSLGSFTIQQILAENDIHPSKSVLFSSAPTIKLPTVLKFVGNLTKAFVSDFIGKTMPHLPSKLESVTSTHDIKMEKEDNYYKHVIRKASSRAVAEAIKNIVFEYRFVSNTKMNNAKYLIVAGEKDKLVPAKSTKMFLKYFPNAEYIEVKNAGHDETVNRFLEQEKDKLFQYLGVEY